LYNSPGRQDKTGAQQARPYASKGFEQSLGYVYFQTNPALFPGTVMDMFLNDKNTRKNDG
jgi:hypothetical protein